MISEKTVELNLTSELLERLRLVLGGHFYAVGFTQREESVLALDAALRSTGAPLLVQYKRAYETSRGLRWYLNRTSTRDQHLRLQALEAIGLVVTYALPCFAHEQALQFASPALLARTAFVPPLALSLPGGPVGHHHLELNTSTGVWTVHSRKGEPMPRPLSVDELLARVAENAGQPRGSLAVAAARIAELDNRVVVRSPRPLNWRASLALFMPGSLVSAG